MDEILLAKINQADYLHPFILRSLGYSYEKIAVSLDKSVRQIRNYNPYSKSKKKSTPPLSVCRLAAIECRNAIGSGKLPQNLYEFREYLNMSVNL